MSDALAPRVIANATAEAPPAVLASSSRARRRLLEGAGVPVVVEAPRVDEDGVKAALHDAGADAGRVAETLAELKARRVSRGHPGALVIGADQVLDCDGRWFDKPSDRDRAAADL